MTSGVGVGPGSVGSSSSGSVGSSSSGSLGSRDATAPLGLGSLGLLGSSAPEAPTPVSGSLTPVATVASPRPVSLEHAAASSTSVATASSAVAVVPLLINFYDAGQRPLVARQPDRAGAHRTMLQIELRPLPALLSVATRFPVGAGSGRSAMQLRVRVRWRAGTDPHAIRSYGVGEGLAVLYSVLVEAVDAP